MLQYKNLTRTEALAMVVVTIFGSSAVTSEVIAVTALPRFLSAGKEALFGARISAWQGSVESLVVDVQNDVTALCCLFGGNVDTLRARGFAYSGPGTRTVWITCNG